MPQRSELLATCATSAGMPPLGRRLPGQHQHSTRKDLARWKYPFLSSHGTFGPYLKDSVKRTNLGVCWRCAATSPGFTPWPGARLVTTRRVMQKKIWRLCKRRGLVVPSVGEKFGDKIVMPVVLTFLRDTRLLERLWR